jgi:hypothetical protein
MGPVVFAAGFSARATAAAATKAAAQSVATASQPPIERVR